MSDKKLDIKDYLHLYIGCEVQINQGDDRETRMITPSFLYTFFDEDIGEYLNDPKPILRRLSDMTEEEKKEYRKVDRNYSTDNILPEIPFGKMLQAHHSRKSDEITRFLVSKGFDLFGLIDAGLAIDAKTVPA